MEDEHGVTYGSDKSRQNKDKKYEEGIQYITPQLRDIASRANAVDEALHRFVSAKFCTRLREVGLLNHPLVVEELQRYSKLNDRLERTLAFSLQSSSSIINPCTWHDRARGRVVFSNIPRCNPSSRSILLFQLGVAGV